MYLKKNIVLNWTETQFILYRSMCLNQETILGILHIFQGFFFNRNTEHKFLSLNIYLFGSLQLISIFFLLLSFDFNLSTNIIKTIRGNKEKPKHLFFCQCISIRV